MRISTDIRRTIRIAGPVILGQLSYIALGVIDSMMVGRLGATPLAAAALANSYLAIPLTFCFGLAAGIAPIAANFKARKDLDGLQGLLRNGFWTTLVAGLICGLLMVLCIFVLRWMQQPAAVIAAAKPYIYLLAASLIPQALFLNYKNFTEGLEWMRPALYVSLASIPVNFLLNYLLIFGAMGFPAWGLVGAGVATVITRSLMLIAIIGLVQQSRLRKYLDLRWRFNIITIRRILYLGIPAGIQYVFETAAFAFAAILMGILGTYQLAAHQIAINLASIPFMVCIGLSAAASIRMGQHYGAQDGAGIKTTGWNILRISVGFMAFSALVFFTTRHWLPLLYIDNPEVIAMAAHMLLVAAFFQLSDGLQAVGVGLLRGIEDVKWPTFFSLTAYWLVGLPLGALLCFHFDWGYIGIWIGLLTGLTASAILLVIRFWKLSDKYHELWS